MGRKAFEALMIFVACACWSACKKETSPGPVNLAGSKVFVVCEGSFHNGNASLWVYLNDKDTVYKDVYKAVNGKDLGDVFQSMIAVDSSYLLCINNSDKLLLTDRSLVLRQAISVSKPRYILPVSATKAYVSSLYTNKLFVLDLTSYSISGSVELPSLNTEGLILHQGRVYVCPWDTASDKVYVLNPANDKLVDSFSVAGRAPSEILVDAEDKLWVLSGNVTKGKPAFWTKVDPATKQILLSFAFPADADPVKPVMNLNRDSLYFIEVNYKLGADHNGVFRMSIYEQSLPQTPFIPAAAGQYYWALGINPLTGDIFVGDPKGFSQQSSVDIYDTRGQRKRTFLAGAGVGHFYFAN